MNGTISLLPYTPSSSVQEKHHFHSKKRHISNLALLNSLQRHQQLTAPHISVLPTYRIRQCFSNAMPRPGTGPWHQLYRAARDSPGIDN